MQKEHRENTKMGEENKIVLHGMWASPYVKRVELALKSKGIPFEYVEEDLRNKSPLLLQYNPVYKKVPVLVHKGKPISESLIIIEYIDENWKNKPRLLPDDPYKRAKVRFWAGYIQQMLETTRELFNPEKELQEKGLEEVYQKLQILEDGMKDMFPGGVPEVNTENLGLLDIMMAASFGAYRSYEEVLGMKTLDPERNPLLFSWVEALIKLPVVKEIIPPHEKLVGLLEVLKHGGFRISNK